jgi:hypothetical protein
VLARFWQPRFYEFNVFTARKRIEKLRYGEASQPKLNGWPEARLVMKAAAH